VTAGAAAASPPPGAGPAAGWPPAGWLFLLAAARPQMYGVGYPVMYNATAGQYALWFLIVLAFAKIAACSLTIGIGGSGGVIGPQQERQTLARLRRGGAAGRRATMPAEW